MKKEKEKKLPKQKNLSDDEMLWGTEGKLALLEGWARDGYTYQDIANCIGITLRQLTYWRRHNPDIEKALSKGRDEVDYLVENALLKAALGYRTQESKVTTVIQRGEVVETVKETLSKEQSPNVSAIQCWLYNRRQSKWKNMNSRSNIIDDLDAETSIEIKVTRAGDSGKETETGNVTEDTKSEMENVNSSVTISKRDPKEARKSKEEKKREEDGLRTKIEDDEEDLNYWPDDWSEDEDN